MRIINADALTALPQLAAEGFRAHSVVCDPPYHLTSIVKRFGSENAAPVKPGAYGRAAAGFMGQQWDGGDVAFRAETWRAVFDCMLPGAHLAAFGSTRTFHRMVCAIEDAGLEIRDTICWLYGSGFPKNLNVTRGLESLLPADAQCVCAPGYPQTTQGSRSDCPAYRGSDDGQPRSAEGGGQGELPSSGDARARSRVDPLGDVPAGGRASTSLGVESALPATDCSLHQGARQPTGFLECDTAPSCTASNTSHGAGSVPHKTEPDIRDRSDLDGGSASSSQATSSERHPNMARCAVCGKIKVPQGVGSALKPAMELICLARKPLDGTVAANVLRHGTGALNIDACRVPAGDNVKFDRAPGGVSRENWRKGTCVGPAQPAGNRWPANCVHDGSPEVEEAFARFGERASGQLKPEHQARGGFAHTNCYHAGSTKGGDGSWEANTGSASRFFFCAKADASDRAGSRHPTVKPTALMRWLVQLVTPPGGTTLDPFAGTGSTGLAADQLGMSAVLIERDAKYAADAERKIKQDAPLFACVRQPTPDLDAAYQRQPGLWEAAE